MTKIFQIWSQSVLIEIEVVRNDISNNLYLHEKLLILQSSPSGSLQSWLIQLFSITQYTVLVEIKVIRNYVINNFKLCDQLFRTHSWSSAISQKKIIFWSTLKALSEETVHFQELVMGYKVVVNSIIDIIHFDQNTVRCHWN